MSIREAARYRFGHQHSTAIVVGGWLVKLLILFAIVAGVKWLYEQVPSGADWRLLAGGAAVVLFLCYFVARLFRPRIRG